MAIRKPAFKGVPPPTEEDIRKMEKEFEIPKTVDEEEQEKDSKKPDYEEELFDMYKNHIQGLQSDIQELKSKLDEKESQHDIEEEKDQPKQEEEKEEPQKEATTVSDLDLINYIMDRLDNIQEEALSLKRVLKKLLEVKKWIKQ